MRAWLPWKGGGSTNTGNDRSNSTNNNNNNNNSGDDDGGAGGSSSSRSIRGRANSLSSTSQLQQAGTPQDAILRLQQQQQQQQRGERGMRASANSPPVNIISRPWNLAASASSLQQQQQPQQPGRLTGGAAAGGGGVIQALMAGQHPHPPPPPPHHHHHHHHRFHNSAKVDADIERRVAICARNLGEGVGRIVLAARMGGGTSSSSGGNTAAGGGGDAGEWKAQLLQLLGGSDDDVAKFQVNNAEYADDEDGHDYRDNTAPIGIRTPAVLQMEPTDIDYLLNHSSTCERFVLRCVENELPPNLIHCLRLLRVLELQRDQQQQQQLYHRSQVSKNVATTIKHGSSGSKSFGKDEDGEEDKMYDKEGNEVIGRDDTNNDVVEKATKTSISPPAASTPIGPISQTAASKVSRLLCHLCSDSSVGEQLRPHLFGLLALSGASYPQCGVHIASAASDVIRAFSSHCLSPSLVWFLNDRKMIVHMTDDIKELCAMTPVSPHVSTSSSGGVGSTSSFPSSSTSSSRRSLYGSDAEIAGLWVIALRTVVYLVANSCNYQCVELLKDFDGAGGYHVLAYAIAHSSERHVPKLLELVTILVCCKIATSSVSLHSTRSNLQLLSEGGGAGTGGEGASDNNIMMDDDIANAMVDVAENKVAMNTNAFEIMDGLMMRSIPLLKAYENEHEGRRPAFVGHRVNLTEMSDFAVTYAWEMLLERNQHAKTQISSVTEAVVDLTSELLVTTLQLYSDHAKNFDLIESEYHTLSHYLLSFPSLSDVSVKVLTLKTLEYVCTGVAGANSLMPLRVVTEIFISQCKLLLKVASSKGDGNDDDIATAAFETARQDLQMLCDTLLKLLEFDETVSHVMLDCDLLGSKLDDVLNIITTSLANSGDKGGGDCLSHDKKRAIPTPAVKTNIDSIYECLCRVLKLVAKQPVARIASEDNLSSSPSKNASSRASCRLTSFLSVGILNLGDSAAKAALGVFDALMAKNHNSLLRADMTCLLGLLDQLSLYRPGCDDENRQHINPQFITRQTSILDVIKNILPLNLPSQDFFRTCGGFQCLVRLFFCMEGICYSPDGSESVDMATMEILESAFSLLTVATDPNARNLKQSGDMGAPSIAVDILTVDGDLSIASPELPSTANLCYLRKFGFYIEFANAIAGTGILKDITSARRAVNLAMELVHPKLVLSTDGRRTSLNFDAKNSGDESVSIRNADATRLVLGLATRLPDTDDHKALAKSSFDELLRLCANDMAGSSLTRLASSGLCTSLTSRQEFASMLEDRSHFLYSRFVLLLRRIAAFSMTYNDFVSLLRCVAGPILLADQDNVDYSEYGSATSQNNRIRLAVISSSVQNKKISSATKSESWQTREVGFCNRLETLSVIAERGDRVARCEIGGDSLNSIAMYMQKVPLEDRMYTLAEQGRLKFIEIERVDASAQSTPIGVRSTDSSGVWSPLVSSGFTYSVWMRQHHSVKDGSQSSLFIFDISSPPVEKSSSEGSASLFPYGSARHEFFSCWYDVPNQRFCVLTSSNNRGEPTCFPVSPLPAGVWHHIQLSYHAPKRSMLGRKAVINLYIDGRPLESDAKIDAFNLPPTARMHIGVPNPVLASSGIVRGSLPVWDLGPTLLISSVLGLRDATAIYTAGPEFPGLFWGDRPQHWSLAAAATAAFVMLAENGEKGSVAAALRRRKVPSMEAVGHVMRERGLGGGHHIGPESDSLSAVGLLCSISPEQIIFGFRASSSSVNFDGKDCSVRRSFSCRLINMSRISASISISTDAVAYGYSSIISPHCFADNVQWIGGPNILLPIVNAAQSSSSLALSLRMIRESVRRHPPNLEMLQSGGGYRMLALLLTQKRIMDANVLDQCFAFAVHGFVPPVQDKDSSKNKISKIDSPGGVLSKGTTHRWVFADLDAMKYLLLNHQVWDLNGGGPELPLRLMTYLNGLVVAHSTHAAFNSRRLHLLGIIRWALHLMLEATELFAEGASAAAIASKADDSQDKIPRTYDSKLTANASTAFKNGWFTPPPLLSSVISGCDPGNELLLSCKTLLRRVLTFMLTPGDLEAIAGAAIYTLSISGGGAQDMSQSLHRKDSRRNSKSADVLAPGSVTRVYLLRLLEELVVDGVNEIVTDDVRGDTDGPTESTVEPHLGGTSSSGKSYLGTIGVTKRKKHDPSSTQNSSIEAVHHPKYQEAQIFLAAFAGILTPVWFACILEGCREEASASAVLRLMVLMIQNSRKFAVSFDEAGGFAPLVLSIPRFSTCPSIIVPLLSHLLHAPILRLPCFSTLDPKQLCDAFDAESDADELITDEQDSQRIYSDSSCGIFALLAECLGRNIQLASFDYEMGLCARRTNEAVLHLLSHQHAFSRPFQSFCRTPDFLEPLAQALCLAHDEQLQKLNISRDGDTLIVQEDRDDFIAWPSENSDGPSSERRKSLSKVDTSITPTERLVGRPDEDPGSGIGMVHLLHIVLSHAVLQEPIAAPLVSALFRSFPIHASPDQVEAFHMALIEHCGSVVKDVMQRGEPFAIANCIGVCSVLLDRLMAGFFTSEPILEVVNIVMFTLISLTSSGTYASRTLANVDQNFLVADTAHIARLTCLTALLRSRSMGDYDDGGDALKLGVLKKIVEFMRQLLLVPSNLPSGHGILRKQGGYPIPAPTSRFFSLWQSANLSRCSPSSMSCNYPDLTAVEDPDQAFIVTLMAEIHSLLLAKNGELREQAAAVVVSLLQRRQETMSELLITDIPRGDHIETVDLINHGGFGSLETTQISESTAFFGWLERNQEQVAAVFHGICVQASRMGIAANVGAISPEEAIENEQKLMLRKLTSHDSSDRTILGGVGRAELFQRAQKATAETHALWKRQGFDDLSSGAMQWKILLRQLKGSCTIWEGGADLLNLNLFDKSILVSSLLTTCSNTSRDHSSYLDLRVDTSNGTVKRWKLDLTEGYEHQRRRLLPNYEFHGLYNIDEKVDNVQYVDETGLRAIESFKETPTGDHNSEPLSNTVGQAVMITPGELEVTADLLKRMKLEKRHDDVDDDNDHDDMIEDGENGGKVSDVEGKGVMITTGELEVTADLLKKMKLEKRRDDGNDDEIIDDEDNDAFSMSAQDESMIITHTASVDDQSAPTDRIDKIHQSSEDDAKNDEDERNSGDNQANADEGEKGTIAASSYDLITGLLKVGDWPEESYNVSRCTGLEVRKALLLWCRNAFYVIDGFEQTDGEGLKGKITRLKKATTKFQVNIRQRNPDDLDPPVEKVKGKEKSSQDSSAEEITYQHRSQRIAFTDLYSVYRRRYQLQQNALEFFDVHRNGTLIAFTTTNEREEVLSKVLSKPLPSSIFSSSALSGSTTINYNKFMNNLRAKITSLWVQGKITNFEFIMQMNSFAGRTYNDLTQYPVFPWVLADYESEELDLNDPSIYRDFSKPMGAQSPTRANQFKDRYESLKQSYAAGVGPPPFHYGTHYSCAAYVLHYLMRLEPFSRLALALQGGKFDVADRLFHNIGSSWNSASSENLQDVRELIPEFFYLPDFLVNSNMFDFGTTQSGKTVHDLTLPRWARGDPKRFIRIHRQALESDFVSRNLHQWLDLIFGYKQRGQEAIASLNTFVHVTYEGQVDLDSIEDPVERASIIAQIQNFGQTPSRLERRPFPQRVVVSAFKEKGLDSNSLASLATLTPPFCVVGAHQRVYLRVSAVDTCKIGMTGQIDSSVGDMCLVKGQLAGVGRSCGFILPSKKYYRYGWPNNGISVHVAMTTARYREVNKVLSIHDGMHRGPISVAKSSLNGIWLVTGCIDSTVRVWKYDGQNMQLQATLCGHDGGRITCLDISTTFGMIVTGGSDGKILVWDLRTLTFLRQLNQISSRPCSAHDGFANCFPIKSVSINHKNGNIVTLVHSSLRVFDINGNLVAKQFSAEELEGNNMPSCAISTDCPEWMESGVVAVSGHMNGSVRLWSINYDREQLVVRHKLQEHVHSCPITALRVTGDRQDTLLVGDKSGKMSASSTLKLDQLSTGELSTFLADMYC